MRKRRQIVRNPDAPLVCECTTCNPPLDCATIELFYEHCASTHPGGQTKCWFPNCIHETETPESLVDHYRTSHGTQHFFICGGPHPNRKLCGIEMRKLDHMRHHFLSQYCDFHGRKIQDELWNSDKIEDVLILDPNNPNRNIYTCRWTLPETSNPASISS